MRKQVIYSFIPIFILILFTSCAHIKKTNSETEYSEQFKYVLFDNLSKEILPEISQYMEENYSRILNNLQVEKLPKITVKIWSNNENYLIEQERSIGSRYPGSTGYVSNDELRLLYTWADTASTALHEFVHIVSFKINPEIGNNPRWLWEAVAIYESNYPPFEMYNLYYITEENYPSLAELNQGLNSSVIIYEIGYTLIEFIIENWGNDAVCELILTNGNIQSVLKISTEEFEKQWYQFVKQKYLSFRSGI